MTDHSRQLTLTAAVADVTELQHYDWTFARADTTYYTHGLHRYPARMPPQIPATLLDFYEGEGTITPESTVYDPFSGSGTTSVEARLHGHHAVANDINPFACLLTKAKATPLAPETLEAAQQDLLEGLNHTFGSIKEVDGEPTQYLSERSLEDADKIGTEWFPQPQLYQLLYTRDQLDQLEEEHSQAIVQFLRVCLAKASRKVSYQRLHEFKRYRMAEEDRTTHNPSVIKELRDAINDNVARMREYSEVVDHALNTTIFQGDSGHIVDSGEAPIGENDADIVITSPPYGDHKTTVAYGQFSTNLSIIAEGRSFDEMFSVDSRGLGGSAAESAALSKLEEYSAGLKETVQQLREIEGRSEDALMFFQDYNEVINEVARITKPGQPVAWVVACRRMSDEVIPMHKITRELCEQRGYEFEAELPRYIKDKTLPSKNRLGETMAKEYIVVMRAPR